jgi:hypothetical protein
MRSMPGISAMYSISSARSAGSSPAGAWPLPLIAPAVGIDVLAEQGDLLTPCAARPGHFGEDVVEGARDLLAARVGHDAERTELAAALHDRDEGRMPSTRAGGRWSNFSISGKEMSTCALPLERRAAIICGRRCRVCGPKTQVDVGCAGDDRRAFLAGDAAADADHQLRIELLQMPDATEVVKHLFLGLFTHRAGVEEDDVGVLGVYRS